jgi:hypothetical protein
MVSVAAAAGAATVAIAPSTFPPPWALPSPPSCPCSWFLPRPWPGGCPFVPGLAGAADVTGAGATRVSARTGCSVTAGAAAGAATAAGCACVGSAGAAGAGAAGGAATLSSARAGLGLATGAARTDAAAIGARGEGERLASHGGASVAGAGWGLEGVSAARITSGAPAPVLDGSAGGAAKMVEPGTFPRRCANAAAPATAPARRTAATTRPMPLMLRPPSAENTTQTRYRRMGIRP